MDDELLDYIDSENKKLIDLCVNKPILVYCDIINKKNGENIFFYNDNEIYSRYFGVISNNISKIDLYNLVDLYKIYMKISKKYNLELPYIKDGIGIFRYKNYSNLYIKIDKIYKIEYRGKSQILDLNLNVDNLNFCRRLVRDSDSLDFNLLDSKLKPNEYNISINILRYIKNIVGKYGLDKIKPHYENNILTIKNRKYYIDTFDNIREIISYNFTKYTKYKYLILKRFSFILLHILLCLIFIIYLIRYILTIFQ